MANNRLGELRRSAAVMTFGPGSVVDFRADGAPVSAVAAGLEEWKTDGYWIKRLHPGKSAEAGVLSALMAQGGYTGPATIVEGVYGALCGIVERISGADACGGGQPS